MTSTIAATQAASPSPSAHAPAPGAAGAVARAPTVPFRSVMLGRLPNAATAKMAPRAAAPAISPRAPAAGSSARDAGSARPREREEAGSPRRARADSDAEKGPRRPHLDESLDPAARQAAHLAPPAFGAATEPSLGATVPEVHARASLEHLLPALVKRIAWAGDGRRGSVRMELGSGALSGGTVLVHADGGRVRVEIDAPAGADREAWKKRITDRLTGSGLDVEHVEVT
jgi:hypothetical protein